MIAPCDPGHPVIAICDQSHLVGLATPLFLALPQWLVMILVHSEHRRLRPVTIVLFERLHENEI